MNYTDIYRRIYESVKTEIIDHTDAHYASLRIADAISYLSLSCEKKASTLEVIKDIVLSLRSDAIIEQDQQ
jgi:hypothetical protein